MMLSVIILTKNSAEKLEDCLKSVRQLVPVLSGTGLAEEMGEIIFVDGGSTDKTIEIGEKFGVRIVKQKKGSYDTWRNQGKEVAQGEWLFYIDPDERISPKLRKEISDVADPAARSSRPTSSLDAAVAWQDSLRVRHPLNQQFVAFAVPRRNFVLGKELHHGGWWPDYVIRLIKKDTLIKWEGELHEQPKFDGPLGHLKNPFIHLKEEKLSDMVKKTNNWSIIEARLLYDSNHPKMTWWRFVRPVVTEVFIRLVIKFGFLDGVEGIIFSFYQGYSRFMTYAKLWEMQNKNSKFKVQSSK